MARITVEDCIDKLPSRFELVLVASQRARKLYSGETPTVVTDNDKNTVIALREIADSTLTTDEMKENLIQEYQTVTLSDEEDEIFELESSNETTNENEESKSPNYEKKRDVSAEVINQESSGGGGDEQTSTKNENIKTEGNEAVITGDSEQVDIIEKSDSIDENKSSEEGPSKETILESNQEKPNEPSTIGEEK